MSIFNFIMTYDFKRPNPEIVCDLIYIAVGYRLETWAVKFGKTKELDPRPDIEDDPNSYIPAKVDPKFDYRMKPGNTGFVYMRVPLAAIRPVDDELIQPLAIPFTTYDILPQINKQLGLALTRDDLENIEYTTMDDDFKIVAKPDSMVWIGWRNITVLGGGKKYLLFPDYLLNGFNSAPQVPADKLAGLTQIANAQNRTTWREMFDFDYGAVIANVVGAGLRNTKIFVKAHKEGYIDQWLFYTRTDPSTINDSIVGPKPTITVPSTPYTTYEIIEQLNLELGLHLTQDDLVNEVFPPGQKIVTVKFKTTSLGWLPGTYSFPVKNRAAQRLRLISPGVYRLVTAAVPRRWG